MEANGAIIVPMKSDGNTQLHIRSMTHGKRLSSFVDFVLRLKNFVLDQRKEFIMDESD